MKYPIIRDRPTLTVTLRKGWRQWLVENHHKFHEIWLVYYKKHTGKPTITKAEAIEEAICYGWIDSIVMTIDDERYMQRYTPRKPNSIWSELNKKTVTKLEAEMLIEPPGQALIDHARASGEWSKDRSTPDVVEVPKKFLKRLQEDPKAQLAWNNLPPSQCKQFLLYITMAKLEETKDRRISKCIKMLSSNQPPSML